MLCGDFIYGMMKFELAHKEPGGFVCKNLQNFSISCWSFTKNLQLVKDWSKLKSN